ncbi:hypothetical protein [Streptomyces sp. NPDC047028]|uniref:hypothetical protein n=1 Tax=Streptomyces sp. NPDC047028 TaxID=3155793 RepID=UPI0033EB9E66
MRKISKVVAATAMAVGVSLVGIGPAAAQTGMRGGMHGGGGCQSHNLNIDILGELGVANGLAGNLLNGEGDPGGQHTYFGSGC